MSRLASDDSNRAKRSCKDVGIQVSTRAKIYRDRGCQADTFSMELTRPYAMAFNRLDQREITSSVSSPSLEATRCPPGGYQPAPDIRPAPSFSQQQAPTRDPADIPAAVIADVKQYYVDNFLRQQAQTMLIDKLARQLKQAKAEESLPIERKRRLCCSSFDEGAASSSALDAGADERSRTCHLEPARSKSYQGQRATKNRGQTIRKNSQSTNIKKTKADGALRENRPTTCRLTPVAAESSHTLPSESTSRKAEQVRAYRPTALKSCKNKEPRRTDSKHSRNRKGATSRSCSEEEDRQADHGGSRLIRWADHQKKLDLIDALDKEKGELQLELSEAKRQVETLRSS